MKQSAFRLLKVKDFHSSPKIIRIVKLRRIRWVGCGRQKETYKGCLLGNVKGKAHLEESNIPQKILTLISNN
jgi:hypothetical protein